MSRKCVKKDEKKHPENQVLFYDNDNYEQIWK